MSNPTPIIPPVVPYPATYRPFTTAVPFTARSGATFQDELYGVKNWLDETLVPYLNEQFPAFTDSWKAMSEEIIESFNGSVENLTALVNDKIEEVIAGTGFTTGYDIFVLAGQSNMSGRGTPYSSSLDPVNSKIFQYGSKTVNIRPANEPLDMQDIASGIGPGLQFARWYSARKLDVNRKVLLIPVAYGGTQLSTNDSPLGWRRGVAGNLYAQMITKTLAAKALVDAVPGSVNKLCGLLWCQGETDGTNNVTGSVYKTDFDAVINGSRTDLNEASLPWIILTMVPEYLNVGTRTQINAVHRDTPNRIAKVDIALGAVNMNKNDGNHYSGPGQRFNGRAMFDAYERISEGIAPYQEGLPADLGPVLNVAFGTKTKSFTLPMTWDAVTGAATYNIEARKVGDTNFDIVGQFSTNSGSAGGLQPSTSYELKVTPVSSTGVLGYPSTIVTTSTIASTTIVSDTFTRASIGSTDTGQTWQTVTGTLAVDGTRAYHGGSASIGEIESGVSDGIMEWQFPILNGTGFFNRVIWRGDGTTSNYWMLQYRQSTNKYQLYKCVGGATSQVGIDFEVVPQPGDIIRVTFSDNYIVVRINGTVQRRVFDTDLKTNTKHGYGGQGNIARYDNFLILN